MEYRINNLYAGYLRLWENLSGWKYFLFYTLHYTLLYAVLSTLIFLPFFAGGTSFVWTDDGLPQHFTRLIYISQNIRKCIQSLLVGKGWTIPLYDFRTGPVVQDLQIGFPQILAVLFPWDRMDTFYTIYVLVNYYLIGLSFSFFGFYFHQKALPIVLGAVTYTFCGYSLFAGVRHPHFVVPMIFLPLLIIGAEKVLHKKKSYLLMVSVFLSLTTQWGLYFSCMQAILVILYIGLRFFDVYTKKWWKEFWGLCGRLCIWGGIGILLAGVVVVPSLISVLGIGRIGKNAFSYSSATHYSAGYYEKFLANFGLISNSVGNWTYLGFSVLTIPALFLLFIRNRKEERTLRRLFLILTAMLLIPVFAYIMSGFSNISNRFCFSYAFCISAILMFMMPHFIHEAYSVLLKVGSATIIYFIACCFVVKDQYFRLDSFTILFLSLFLLFCLLGCRDGKKVFLKVCLGLTCFSVYYSAVLLYSPKQGNYIKEFQDEPYAPLIHGQYSSLGRSKIVSEDNSVYYVAGNNIGLSEIAISFYYNLNSLSMYPYFGWSTEYVDWTNEMELSHRANKHKLYGLDSRAALLTLAGVKYYADRKETNYAVPYGFTEVDCLKNGKYTDVILKNQNWLPIGYTYEKYIGQEQYDSLEALGKQQAQLQAVYLKEEPEMISLEEALIVPTARKIPCKVVETDGLAWEGSHLDVMKKGATMTVTFSGLPEAETYLRIVGLDLTDNASMRAWSLTASTGKTFAKAYFMADANVYSHGQKTQMLDLGYDKAARTTVTITFPKKGEFFLQDIEIWCQPTGHYQEQIDMLREEALENIEMSGNGLSGTISVSKDKFLCLSIPYTTGWTAYVDNRQVHLYQANTGFMGVMLPAGSHTVELRYQLPGIKVGLMLSFLGLICLTAVMITSYKKK